MRTTFAGKTLVHAITGLRQSRVRIAFSLLILGAVPGLGLAQSTFTRITAGPMVADRGNSVGCAWGDYDNDGFIDLFVANGGADAAQRNFLYRNNRDGSFTRITDPNAGGIVTDSDLFVSPAWADFDNDGNLDLFVTSAKYRANYLYRNNGNGIFTRISSGPIGTDAWYSWGASWGDFDNDGWVDLFVGDGDEGRQKANTLYRNEGEGRFVDVTRGDILADKFDMNGCAWGDLDNDGDLDLYVPRFGAGSQNQLYRNDGAGRFTKLSDTEAAKGGGRAVDPSWTDYDNDGDLDLFVTSAAAPTENLLFNNQGGILVRTDAGALTKTHGVIGKWADYDNDGFIDVLMTRSEGGSSTCLLLRNAGNGTFDEVLNGSPVEDRGSWTGASWGDYDNDGFMDLFVATAGANVNALYHNDGNSNGWIILKLVGGVSNRSGIGAKVRVKATIGGNDVWQMREVSGGSIGQNDLRVHFGLGDATNITQMRIEWPSGIVQEMNNVTAKQILTVVEPFVLQVISVGHIRVRGAKDRDYAIEASTDLSTWTRVGVIKGQAEFQDTRAIFVGFPAVFYRAFAL